MFQACFEDNDGNVHERDYNCWKDCPKYIIESGRRFNRSFRAEQLLTHSPTGDHKGWPLLSDAAGVHPSQVKEATESARASGVPTNFTKDGRAIFRNRRHRKAYCESIGLFDMSGGYGDPSRK